MTAVYISREPDYADLDLDFQIHPVTKQLIKKTGADAVKRSIRNLIFTNYYERPCKSYIGSNIPALLFDNADPLTASFLEDAIKLLINNFEPRVRLTNVKVVVDMDNNGFNATIEYVILNRELPVTFNLFLERIR